MSRLILHSIFYCWLVVAGCTPSGLREVSERKLFLQLNDESLSSYRQFNLTSRESEVYHFNDRLSLLQAMKLSSSSKDKETSARIIKEFEDEREEFASFWDEFYSDVNTEATLYFVSFKKHEDERVADLSGYYLIKNGLLIKESLTEW